MAIYYKTIEINSLLKEYFPIYNNRSILCQKWISSRCKIIDGVPKAYMIDLREE